MYYCMEGLAEYNVGCDEKEVRIEEAYTNSFHNIDGYLKKGVIDWVNMQLENWTKRMYL